MGGEFLSQQIKTMANRIRTDHAEIFAVHRGIFSDILDPHDEAMGEISATLLKAWRISMDRAEEWQEQYSRMQTTLDDIARTGEIKIEQLRIIAQGAMVLDHFLDDQVREIVETKAHVDRFRESVAPGEALDEDEHKSRVPPTENVPYMDQEDRDADEKEVDHLLDQMDTAERNKALMVDIDRLFGLIGKREMLSINVSEDVAILRDDDDEIRGGNITP